MKNIKLCVQFDGTDYHGWQIQKNARTVQETLENAVSSLTGTGVRITGCGRTDSGVHAVNFVCNFFSDTSVPPEKLPFALNHRLPGDIICKKAEYADENFHSKNSARAKTYVYKIFNDSFPDVFSQRYSWHIKDPLDTGAMSLAAKGFLGEHDFMGFASSGFSVKTTVRTVYSLNVDTDGKNITVSVTGNGFLYNMVRIIAGTLVFAGLGKINPADISDIINSKDRTRAGITAPPNGLFLKEVYY
ncbi:MAG: tRNA pseudouridine(38-40) synthase TruA [Oscillospiraceae bacterium]|nr:tRNA pseudouridine(38-40) synthase TruA [Oscillospiraceae bacterium]